MTIKRFFKQRISYIPLCFCLLAFSITAQGQSAGLHVYNGMIRVKMENENILPSPASYTSASRQAMPQRTGIARLDALNEQYNVSTYLRVFPYAGEYEEKHRQYGLHLWYDLFIDESADPAAVAAEYSTVPGVLAAEPIYRIAQKELMDVPEDAMEQLAATGTTFNDPDFGKQWNYKNDGTLLGATEDVDIDLTEAWEITTGSPNVIVCVIDDGVDYMHADLANNMWKNTNEIAGNGIDDDGNGFVDDVYGFNFVANTGNIVPGDHGTMVAGVIAAVNHNGIGISSIAGGNGSGNGVKIMSAQTFRGAASTTAGPAFVYAADNGAVIAQCSWGYSVTETQNQSDLEALSYFIKQAGRDKNGNPRPNTPMVGGLAIFSAGNAGNNTPIYPGAGVNVMAVASVGISGRKPSYSNYGSWVDISAPGGDALNGMPTIYGTLTNNSYGYKQGTSFACPHVSGVAALILSKYGHSSYTPDSLRVRLEATATSLYDLEPDNAQYMGWGLLNAANALQPFVGATGISIPDVIELEIGQVYIPDNLIIPSNATDQRIKWSNYNANIISVDLRGRIMGISTGETQITGTSYNDDYSKTCTIRVNTTAVRELHLSIEQLSIALGNTYQIEATLIPSNAANPTIRWSSSNGNIVSVNSRGLITAIAEGTATITAATVDGNITDHCTITVTPIVSGIAVNPKNISLIVGQQYTFNAEVLPATAANRAYSWKSSDPSYVSINESGIATAIKSGKYGELISIQISAITEDGGFSDNAAVIVQPEMVIPEGFSPNGDGINDYFAISSLGDEAYTLRIFDKSGQLCYESISYQNSWDGTANTGVQKGKKVSAGTYYYILSKSSDNKPKKGYVIIKY